MENRIAQGGQSQRQFQSADRRLATLTRLAIEISYSVAVLLMFLNSAVFAIDAYSPPDDPYSVNVLGYLLRLPILLDVLSAELRLAKSQEDALAKIIGEINAPTDSSIVCFDFSVEEIDLYIKMHLSPFQYVRFRDWIIQQWELEKGELGPPVEAIAKMNEYTLYFLKAQVALPFEICQQVLFTLIEYQEQLLVLRRDLLSLVNNPLIPWNELELEGRKIVEQIAEIAKCQIEAIMQKLTSEQKEKLQALMESK